MTPTQSGYSTSTAGPSNLSILPPSSPPDNFWDDLHKLTSDIEQDRRSDGRSASDSSDPSSPVLSSMEVERCAGALVHWEPGSVWNSYPYQQHEAQALPWEPVGLKVIISCTYFQASARRFWLHPKSWMTILALSVEVLRLQHLLQGLWDVQLSLPKYAIL